MFKPFAVTTMVILFVSQGTSAHATPEQFQAAATKSFVAQAPLKIKPVSKNARTLVNPVSQPVYQRPRIRKPRFGIFQPTAVAPLPAQRARPGPKQTNLNFINSRFALHLKIDLKTQRMHVYRRGRLHHIWAISGGTSQYPTPVGTFDVDRMYPMFIATNWNNSKMPNAVFFEGDYAIHGTDKLHKLGQPASHGCIRLHPVNAKLLYEMIQKTGQRGTQIEVNS